MPFMEAFPDETQMMKYKLATLPRGTAKMPILDLGQTSVSLTQLAEKGLTPQTLNYLGNTTTYETAGYSFTISDVRLFSSFVATGIDTPAAQSANSTETLGTNVSKTVIGTTLTMRATGVNTLFGDQTTLYATLTVTGRDSGARLQIPVQINKAAQTTA